MSISLHKIYHSIHRPTCEMVLILAVACPYFLGTNRDIEKERTTRRGEKGIEMTITHHDRETKERST